MVPYMQKNGNLILKLAKWNEVKSVIFWFYTTRVIWAYEFISNGLDKTENMVNFTSTDIYIKLTRTHSCCSIRKSCFD